MALFMVLIGFRGILRTKKGNQFLVSELVAYLTATGIEPVTPTV